MVTSSGFFMHYKKAILNSFINMGIIMKTAEIYTKPSCPWCVRAKDLLKLNGISYVEYVLGVDGVTKETIEKKLGDGTQIRTVPQIFIDGKYVGGCTDLMKLLGV